MWDGSSVGTRVPRIDQFGLDRAQDPFPWVWTGTDVDGTVHGLGLGGASDNFAGEYTSTLATWLLWGHFSANTELPLYALSNPLKAVTQTVPEPSGLACVGIIAAGWILRGRVSARSTGRRGGPSGRAR
jgi:hypothetical protein